MSARISIDEGKRFIIHRIAFIGVDKGEEELLRQTFPLKTGDIFVESKCREGIDAINKSGEYYQINNEDDVENDPQVEIRTDEEVGDLDIIIKLNRVKGEPENDPSWPSLRV